MMDQTNSLSVEAALAGRRILLTGSTGLFGKAVLNKVARAAPGPQRIYVLLRPRGRASAAERFAGEVLGDDLFGGATAGAAGKGVVKSLLERTVVVEGDVSRRDLGIRADWLARLRSDVDLIINCAGTIRFHAPLVEAFPVNSLGPSRLAEFADGCERQVSIVHVSTCFAAAARDGVIMESGGENAESTGGGRRVHALRECRAALGLDGGPVAPVEGTDHGFRIAREYGWIDTYTLTKALGEHLLQRNTLRSRVVVFRPSILLCTLQDPTPGWMDRRQFFQCVARRWCRGNLRRLRGDPRAVLDIVPLDLAVNALLVSFADAQEAARSFTVYQFASGAANRITVSEFIEHMDQWRRQWRTRVPSPVRGSNHDAHDCRIHAAAAVAAGGDRFDHPDDTRGMEWDPDVSTPDRARREQLHRAIERIYEPYARLHCRFSSGRLQTAWKRLRWGERDRYCCDVKRVNWNTFLRNVYFESLMGNRQS